MFKKDENLILIVQRNSTFMAELRNTKGINVTCK
jgi:hypothetical protein